MAYRSLYTGGEIDNCIYNSKQGVANRDVVKIKGWLNSGQAVNIAMLGDSILTGVGSGHGLYGEVDDWLDTPLMHNIFTFSLLRSDPNFVPLKSGLATSSANVNSNTPTGCTYYPSHGFTVSPASSATYTLGADVWGQTLPKKVTVYHLVRTTETAPSFDITVNAEDPVAADSFVAKVDAGVGATSVGFQIGATTVDVPSGSASVDITIDNLSAPERGVGSNTGNGTMVILGFSRGEGVRVKNYCVSSTTLLNESDANTTRGVTTGGQLTKAYTFGANVFFVCFGTNDSKAGVSTPSAFEDDLITRIGEIRSQNSEAVIILFTAPAGRTASAYENNTGYNEVVRAVAAATQCSYVDIEAIFSGVDGGGTYNATTSPTEVYADDVHPSQAGEKVLWNEMLRLFGIPLFDNTRESV